MVGEIIRGGMALGQIVGGLITRPKNRPKYRIPGEINESTNRARTLANASSDTMLQNDEANIDQAGANAVQNVQRTATSGSDAVLSAGNIAGQIASSKLDANRGFAQRKMMNEGQLNSALNTQAQYQDKAFDYNVNQPYQEKMDTSNALLNAGLGNATDATDMMSNRKMIESYNQTPSSSNPSSPSPQVNGMVNKKDFFNMMMNRMRSNTKKLGG